jgi:CheY-like chemotaxis protein
VSRILVADDNSNIQKMVALALKDEGIDVVAVGNGDAAMRKIPDLRPDLVLADIFMPVRNGYEVCEFVKNDSRYMNTPVVLLVGAFDPLDEDETQRVRADGVLKKPFVPPDPLINMVKALLAKSNGQNPAAVVAAAPAQPAFEPQATVTIPPPPPVAPAKTAPEQNPKPKSTATAPSYAAEPVLDEAEEVVTAVRDPNLGEPAWTAPEEAEETGTEAEEESANAADDMLDMHSFGKDEGRDTGRFRPDSAIFDKLDAEDTQAKKTKKRETPKIDAVEIPAVQPKEAVVEASKPIEAALPVEAVSEEAAPAAPAAEEIPVEPFKFDPSLTFSAAPETAEEPQESMPLPELLPAPIEAAPMAEEHALHLEPAALEPATPEPAPLEPAPLEVPVTEHAASFSWPTLADPIEEIPAAPAIPVEAHATFEPPVEAHASVEPAELSSVPLPNQEAVIQAATEAARAAFSELKTFAGLIPTEKAGEETPVLASPPQGQSFNGQTQDKIQEEPASLAYTDAPKATPEMIDAVVSKLLERMQPQIMEVVNREVLRPAIEAIVRREIDKS